MNTVNPWLFWGATSFVTALILIIWWVIKRWIDSQSKWKDGLDKQGGIVTRELYFKWCKEFREKCPIKVLLNWRDSMFEKGGPLMTKDHEFICERITQKVMDRMDECFDHQQKLVDTRLSLIQTTLQKDVLQEIRELKKELQK